MANEMIYKRHETVVRLLKASEPIIGIVDKVGEIVNAATNRTQHLSDHLGEILKILSARCLHNPVL